jgi:single-strand DNA-binding protein
MSSLRNRVILIGRVGAQPETKTLESGSQYTRFSIATSESYKNDEGEKVEDTQWHNIIVWDKKAEIAQKYLKKGSEVAIEGKLVNNHYTDKEGNKKYTTDIVVSELLLIGDKKD